MDANWSTSEACNFVYKAMWLDFVNATTSSTGDLDWLEVGRDRGGIPLYPDSPTPTQKGICNNQEYGYYDAYSTSRRYLDSNGNPIYQIWVITGPSTTGTHNYQLKKTGTNEWKVYIDNVVRLTYSDWKNANAISTAVGWETNTSTATWTSPNYSTEHQYLSPTDGKYNYWNNGTVNNVNTFGLNWKAAFNGTTNGLYSSTQYTR